MVGAGMSDAAPDEHPALGRAGWSQWAASARAQALQMDALSGLRVASESAPDRVEVLRWSSQAGEWVAWLRIERPPVAFFAAQVEAVDAQVPLRESRSDEIVAQAQSAMSFLLAVAAVPWERRPRSLEFLAAALGVQQALQQRIKQSLGCARPHAYRASLMPHVEVPGHGTLPSGHAGESHLVAALIGHWIRRRAARDPRPVMLDRMALRIAENRVVAGVHFPVDSIAGRFLGHAVYRQLVALSGDAQAVPVIARFGVRQDGGEAAWLEQLEAQPKEAEPLNRWALGSISDSSHAVDVREDWRLLWQLACEEW